MEVHEDLTTALGAGYISQQKYDNLDSMSMSIIRLVNGCIRSLKDRKAASEFAAASFRRTPSP